MMREDDPQRRADTRKYLQAMRNNFPGMLRPMSIREKRHVFKSEGWRPPLGGFADLRMASMDAEQADTAIRTVIGKIMRALHFKHTGGIVAAGDDLVVLHWFSNAYAFHLEDEEYTMFRSLPGRPPILRAGRDLSDQFGYRYAVGETRDISAFLIKFRMSLLAVGIVVQTPDLLLLKSSPEVDLPVSGRSGS
jgi:hypothetical protein